ncbi:MAG: DMT family transporter [Rhodospirillales bacterium]
MAVSSSSSGLRPASPPAAAKVAGLDLGLYAVTVFVWGTSWIALKLQVGVVAPEVSLLWRFALAAIIMAGLLALRRKPWRFDWRMHLRFMVMGACLFCFNFLFFYYSAETIPSGLLSVVFSTAAIVNLFLSALVQGTPLRRRMLLAAVLGSSGVACLFWPEIVDTSFDWAAFLGLLLCLLGVLCFSVGNIVSAETQAQGVPVLSANAWGMAYGCAILLLLSLLRDQAFIVETTLAYLASLGYLAIFASVIAFASYLTLVGRIGAGRAGYATVMFPVVALAISSFFEGYSWTWIAALGVVLALSGNLLILTGQRPKTA